MRRLLLIAGGSAALGSFLVDSTDARAAASRAWPPFVLVAGLLLIGEVAHADGLFDGAAALADRVGGRGLALFVALLGVVAVMTAVLNLDTAVVFLTPVLVLAARRRGLDEAPFLYGSLFMANSASLLLPGSNLTNLLVLGREHVSGAMFAARMLPAWVAAIVVTTVGIAALYRRELRGGHTGDAFDVAGSGRLGPFVTVVAGVLVVSLRSPAVAVLGLGVVVVAIAVRRGRLRVEDVVASLDLPVLFGLYGVALGLGTLAGAWSGPARLMHAANAGETAVIGAVGAVLLNNLPAAVLLGSRLPAHPRALLVGLDLGPNLAVSGSLSALLWFKAATKSGAQPSIARVTQIGLVLVPCSLVAALGALAIFAPSRL